MQISLSGAQSKSRAGGKVDPMSSEARLSVVLGTHNRFESLRRCIDSVLAQTHTPSIVYVTDAGSTDGTIEYLKSIASDRVRPIFVGKRLGQAKAYNDVFRTIDTPYVCWISDDNEVVNNGLDVGVRIMDQDRRARIGMVALKVQDQQGPFLGSVYLGGVSEIGVLTSNQGLLRTDVLRKVGYFSETFGFYGIDTDLTAKVLYGGWDVVYTRPVALNHYRDWPADPTTAEHAALARHHAKSLDLYHLKYGGMGADDRFWKTKRRFWAWLKKRVRYDENSTQRRLGGLWRDWNNVFLSRHISPLDLWLTAGRDHYLRQHVPARDLPAEPIPDPVLPTT